MKRAAAVVSHHDGPTQTPPLTRFTMIRCLPFRSHVRNSAPCTAAPVALHLLATRADHPDRAPVVLRGDLGELDWLAARRHAVAVLDSLLHNEPGASFGVELQDLDGTLLFACTGGAA